jgi:hypothetical protein
MRPKSKTTSSRVGCRPLSPALRTYLETGSLADPGFDVFDAIATDETLRSAWNAAREWLVAEWIRQFPGTRPWAWWRYDSPEPRRRVGGVGDVFSPNKLEFGLETDWVTPSMASFYRRHARDFGPFDKVPIDSNDPPRFESESAFLDRYNLLTADERQRLPEDAFEPVAILYDDDPDPAA